MTPDNPAPSVMPAYYAQAPQNRSAHGAGARVHAPPDGELPETARHSLHAEIVVDEETIKPSTKPEP